MRKKNEKFGDARPQRKLAGSSLVEIILYFALLAIFLFAAMIFAIQILNANLISSNIQELQSNVDFMSQKITYSIQTADSVDEASSVFDASPGTLSLNVSTPALSPTQFYLSDGDIYFKEGAAAAIRLNSDQIVADSLIFQRITYPKTPDQIIIDAEFSMANGDIRNLQKTYSFHATISLRK